MGKGRLVRTTRLATTIGFVERHETIPGNASERADRPRLERFRG